MITKEKLRIGSFSFVIMKMGPGGWAVVRERPQLPPRQSLRAHGQPRQAIHGLPVCRRQMGTAIHDRAAGAPSRP
jgi:hypothetical protein